MTDLIKKLIQAQDLEENVKMPLWAVQFKSFYCFMFNHIAGES